MSTSKLETTTVSQLANHNVIYLDQTYPISEALKILFANGVLAAPVLNNENRLCTGIVDVLDLLGYVIGISFDAPTWASEIGIRFATPIYRAIDFSGRDPLISVPDTTRLSDVLRNYFSKGLHRVLVQNPNSNITGILSHVDVMKFLQTQMEDIYSNEFANLGRRRVADFPFPSKVISIQNNALLLSAFQLIAANRVSAIAVVDNTGTLVGNVSATDFQNISALNFLSLRTPLQQYLTAAPVTVGADALLLDTIRLLMDNKVHRVYIVNDANNPIGVVSTTDVMNIVSRELLEQRR